MWIFTKYGFFSAVCARQGDGSHRQSVYKNRIMLRARDKGHLEALQRRFPKLAGFKVQESTTNDYRCRIFIPKHLWAKVLAALANETDYDNFKTAVGRFQGERGHTYKDSLMRVWGAMYGYQRGIYGPGIYDRLRDEHEGDLFDEGDEGEPFDEPDGIVTDEPAPDEEVILVTDADENKLLGVIWWPDEWATSEEAYADAVQSGTLKLVSHPAFERVLWREARRVKATTIFDFEEYKTRPAGQS